MTPLRLLIATNNAHKVAEFRRLLDNDALDLVTPADLGLDLDVDETGDTFEENARIKARAFRDASGLPALADDSGIEVDALDGRPGVRSARYGGPGLDDEGRVRLLLRELDGLPPERRACRYRVVLVLAWPGGREQLAEGVCEGAVAEEPSGANGFGYDPVFHIPALGKTVAELAPSEKDALSHRAQAARRIAPLLQAPSPHTAPSPHSGGPGRGVRDSESTPPLQGAQEGPLSPFRGQGGPVSPFKGQEGPLSPFREQEGPVSPFRGQGGPLSPFRGQGGLTDTLGRPVRDLRISITDRCNFRCPYCMPAEIFGERHHFLPREAILSYEEIARLARLFVELGVTKLRVTGGEPLVRRNVERLVEMLDAIPNVDDLTLTTNGYLLAEQAQALHDAGLRRITVSLDSLDPAVFGAMNGRGYGPEAVLDGIAAAERVGLSPVKINAVVERGVNDDGVLDMVRRFKGTGHIVRFIEYMDVGNLNGWHREQVVPSAELVERVDAVYPIEPLAPNYRGEVAERWRFLDGDGEIGFISSVTQPFCGDCSRVRLSPEGKMLTCLFASGGPDLMGPMRAGESDDELRERIADVWRARTDRYSELRASLPPSAARKIEMYQIGG